MGLGLPRPCLVCGRITAVGQARCEVHRIRRSGLTAAVRKALPHSTPCAACGVLFAKADVRVDHVVPLFAGGADTAANLQLLCHPCHVRKGEGDLAAYEPA